MGLLGIYYLLQIFTGVWVWSHAKVTSCHIRNPHLIKSSYSQKKFCSDLVYASTFSITLNKPTWNVNGMCYFQLWLRSAHMWFVLCFAGTTKCVLTKDLDWMGVNLLDSLPPSHVSCHVDKEVWAGLINTTVRFNMSSAESWQLAISTILPIPIFKKCHDN